MGELGAVVGGVIASVADGKVSVQRVLEEFSFDSTPGTLLPPVLSMRR